MGQRVILVDDFDEKEHPDTESRRFSIGHQAYTIDLGSKNYEAFLKDMEKWVSKATKVSGAPRASRGTSGAKPASNAAQIRSWAASQGIKVNDRGRIHSDVVAKWEAAGRP